jgi:ABC-2 type transport system permease protein
MKRIKAVIIKEFYHILRDPRSLIIVFILPLLMIFIFGASLSFDLEEIETGIIDYSDTPLSRALLQKFTLGTTFKVQVLYPAAGQADPIAEAERRLRSGEIKQYVIIPENFAEMILSQKTAGVETVIDGSDSNSANVIQQYDDMLLMDFLREISPVEDVLTVATKMYFNPENKSTFFIVPGLIAVIMIMVSALLTSLSVAREKESGSIDLLFISPLKSPQIIIGKTFPYILVALLEGVVILLFARYWFQIPFRGSLLILFLFALVYIVTGLSLGITLSTVAATQKVAMIVTLLATLLPSILLSGFIFPLESLGPALRAFSYVVPATYFLDVIRGVVLKGAGLQDFVREGFILLGFSLFFLTVASVRFHKQRKAKS